MPVLNCETSIPGLLGGVVMSNEHFYVRNHFLAPALDPSGWRLKVSGLVKQPMILSLREILNMPARTLQVTLECAGNGRSLLKPTVGGEQWGLGAVSTAEWTGVPLAALLKGAGVDSNTREVVFSGADHPAGESAGNRFQRSLTLDDARHSQALLAYAMNGQPLPIQHGYPLRLIVPGWYAVASVKWLTEIELIGHTFSGHFQTEKYLYEWERDGQRVTEPVRKQRVRALITQPSDGEAVEAGTLAIRGLAWSGVAPIALVEVSVNSGPWLPARMLGQRNRYSWQRWERMERIDRPGKTTLRARATDMAGRTQPDRAPWNRQGYGNNVIQKVTLWTA